MARSGELADHELYTLSRSGNEEAFVELYRRRQRGVFRFALNLSGDEGVAEDVAQEVFVLVAQGALEFDESRGSMQSLLFGVTRNIVRRKTGRSRGLVPIETDDDRGLVPDALIDRSNVLLDLTRTETIERVRKAIGALPAHYREVVVLCDLHEQSYEEAAEALGCAIGTVRSRLHRARGLLVDRLAKPEAARGISLPQASGGCLA